MDNEARQQAQFNKMIKTPIPKLISSLAVPTIISMLVTSIYNMADTFFVGKLGTSATGAVGIVMSIMSIIQSIGFMFGQGSGSLISRLLGAKNYDEANRVSTTGFAMALVFGLCITVFGLIFIDPLMVLLGATPTILPFARAYAQYILFGAPIMAASFVLNNLLRAQGRATLSMIGLGFGGVLNIALDPLFIFVFDMGIAGAAVATLVSQCISFCILLSFFINGKSIVRLKISSVSHKFKTYYDIIKTGLPSFCRQGLASVASVSLNVNAAMYGDAAVAAMSIVGRIAMFVMSFMIGFGQGFQPTIGYNHGAKRYDRVLQSFLFTALTGTVILTVLSILGYIAAPQAIKLFRADDLEVIEIGTRALRAQCIALPLAAMTVTANMAFQVLGRPFLAMFLSATRQGLFFLPLIYILPKFIGLDGVQITQAISDVLSFAVALPCVIFFVREQSALKSKMNLQEKE